MTIRRFLKRTLLDRLPNKHRLFAERLNARVYMRHEPNLLKTLCDRHRDSIDVGANQGEYALFLTQYSRRVYCFEPVAEMCEVLRHRFRGCDVTVECCALGEDSGESELAIPYADSGPLFTRSTFSVSGERHEQQRGNSFRRRRVPVRRLDDWKLTNVGFIKIDVEGFELHVLKGALQTIQCNRPTLFMEIEQRFHQSVRINEVCNWIASLGYHPYFVQRGRLGDIRHFDADRCQQDVDSPNYVSNFLFVPSGSHAHRRAARMVGPVA